MWTLGLLAGVVGCDGAGEVAPRSAALTEPESRWSPAEPWMRAAEVVARRGALVLVRRDAEAAPPGTDVRPAVPMAVLRDDGAALPPPAPVVEGALLDGSVAWVDVDGVLLLDDGAQLRAVADDVHGELAVHPDGRLLAYAMRPGEQGGVSLAAVDGGEPRRVTCGLAVADRPLFADDGALVVVGARAGGVAGVWVVDHAANAASEPQPRPITNAALRAGAPLGAGFVPPPAYHGSMRIEDGALVYDDGEREQRVALEVDQ